MKKLSILFCLLWMSFIFYMSSQSGKISSSQSYTILNLLKQESQSEIAVMKDEPDSKMENLDDELVKSKNGSSSSKKNIKANQHTSRDKTLNRIIRKNAHMFLYFVLAILVSASLFAYNYKGKFALVHIMFVCLLYAVLDEFHQSFVIGRSDLVSDILIDFSGSLIGIGLFYFIYYKIHQKHLERKIKSVA